MGANLLHFQNPLKDKRLNSLTVRLWNKAKALGIRQFLLSAAVLLLIGADSFAQLGNASKNSGSFNPNRFLSGSVPRIFKYSGNLHDFDSGTEAIRRLVVGIFDSEKGGEPLWTEEHQVRSDSFGKFAVVLGSQPNGIPQELLDTTSGLWVGIVSGDANLRRMRLVSVPFALKSSDSEALSGHHVSDFLLKSDLLRFPPPDPRVPCIPAGLCWLPLPGIPLRAPAFYGTSASGPNFISSAISGAPFSVASTDLVPNLNSDLFHGLSDSAFAKIDGLNSYTQLQQFVGGAMFPPQRAPIRAGSAERPSAVQDFQMSVEDTTTQTMTAPFFRWQAEPSNTLGPRSGPQLSLLYSQSVGMAPKETGFSFNQDGTVSFPAAQQVPLENIQAALQAAGLTSAPTGPTAGPPTSVAASRFAWSQSPQGVTSRLQVGPNTVTLTPCPRGVDGTDKWHYLYISGTGTAEADLITGGSCTSGARSGNIQFTAENEHSPGFSISTATDGAQEALNASVVANTYGLQSRDVVLDAGNYTFHGRLSIRSSNIKISGSGSVITCSLRDACVMVGDPTDINAFYKITLDNIQIRPTTIQGIYPAIEDNAQGTTISNLSIGWNAGGGGGFGHLNQSDGDYSATLDRINTTGGAWGWCSIQFCSSAIYGAGKGAGVIWVRNSNLTLNCEGNGIDNFDSNTLNVTDSVIEGYPQFATRSTSTYGVNPAVKWSNVYTEIGNCTNPLGTGIAGLIVLSGYATVSAGAGTADSRLPSYSATGSTPLKYYIVIHSSVYGASGALLAGIARTDGHTRIPVKWTQIGKAGTITYDLLRVQDIVGYGHPAPYGTGTFAVATGLTVANCDGQTCTYTDNPSILPSPYTVPGGADVSYAPSLWFWPSSFVLSGRSDVSINQFAASATLFIDRLVGSASVTSSVGATVPTVFAQQCDSSGSALVWEGCSATDTSVYGDPGATVLQNGGVGNPGKVKGRYIFEVPPGAGIPPQEVFTIADSNREKTMATTNNRPSWDAADTFIALDQAVQRLPDGVQLAFGSNVSISDYIGSVPDDIHWKECLTASSKTFRVPVSSPSYFTTDNCRSISGACGSAAAGIVLIPAGATTGTVNTTAVSPISQIHIDEDLALGPTLAVACDPAWGRQYRVLRHNSGGFVIETNITPATGYACLSFSIIN